MMFVKFIFKNCRRQLIVAKEIFTFKNKAAIDYFQKSRLVVSFFHEPIGYVRLGGVEPQIFLWYNANGSICLTTFPGLSVVKASIRKDRHKRDLRDVS